MTLERVSTHSRPKAAGITHFIPFLHKLFQHTAARRRLEYQNQHHPTFHQFQHTAARRRLVPDNFDIAVLEIVSTHSRPKAAGYADEVTDLKPGVSTHSRPKAAGLVSYEGLSVATVSTHSRPKAAGPENNGSVVIIDVSTHSRPKAAGNLSL